MKPTSGKLKIISLLMLLGILATLLPPPAEAAFPAPETLNADRGTAVSLEDIDPAVFRRAMNLIETVRGSEMAPGWDDAYVGWTATPLYRPDLGETLAYYEFQVYKIDPASGAEVPSGFITVSTGPHDYPIAHWNFEGLSPTQYLESKVVPGMPPISRFYKLDTLSYAGEDAGGNLLASSDTMPNRLVGLPAYSPDLTNQTGEQAWFPVDPEPVDPPDDSGSMTITHTQVLTGLQDAPIDMVAWDSWAQLKVEYQTSYGTLLQDLAAQAAPDWEVESLVAQYGEGLRVGDSVVIPFASAGAQATITGEGASYISSQVISLPGGRPGLRIDVLDDEFGRELPFTVSIDTPAETLHYIIVGETYQTYLPMVLNAPGPLPPGEARPRPAAAAVDRSTQDWHGWYYFWAGYLEYQRNYSQIPKFTWPNTTSCWSGCGATAWSMLFGWADYQAALGNPYWAPRIGIYREGGGYGYDAVAPAYNDGGVNNMMWEIRNRIGTFCVFDSGPTWPWGMGGAQNYLAGRSYARIYTGYNVFGIHSDNLRQYTVDSIIDRGTPAVIGTGWLSHYPLAWGYALRYRLVKRCFLWCWGEVEYNHMFYVNQGWGGTGNGWISAGTWFNGQVFP
jgi:hypothetical protein